MVSVVYVWVSECIGLEENVRGGKVLRAGEEVGRSTGTVTGRV